MAIESAADEVAAELVQMLADEIRRSGTEPHELAVATGIGEDRLELVTVGAWENLTVREIAVITETLDLELFSL